MERGGLGAGWLAGWLATRIREFAPSPAPGLVRTYEYARAVALAANPFVTDEYGGGIASAHDSVVPISRPPEHVRRLGARGTERVTPAVMRAPPGRRGGRQDVRGSGHIRMRNRSYEPTRLGGRAGSRGLRRHRRHPRPDGRGHPPPRPHRLRRLADAAATGRALGDAAQPAPAGRYPRRPGTGVAGRGEAAR
ncbi:protein of unknown function [Streptomyces murinus]